MVLGTIVKLSAKFVVAGVKAWLASEDEKDPSVEQMELALSYPNANPLYVGCRYLFNFSFKIYFGETDDWIDSDNDGGYKVTVKSFGDTKTTEANAAGRSKAHVEGNFTTIAKEHGIGALSTFSVEHWGEQWGSVFTWDIGPITVEYSKPIVKSVEFPLTIEVTPPVPKTIEHGESSTVSLWFHNHSCADATITLRYDTPTAPETVSAKQMNNKKAYTKRHPGPDHPYSADLKWQGGSYRCHIRHIDMGLPGMGAYDHTMHRTDERTATCKGSLTPPAPSPGAGSGLGSGLGPVLPGPGPLPPSPDTLGPVPPQPGSTPPPTVPGEPSLFSKTVLEHLPPTLRDVHVLVTGPRGPIDGTATSVFVQLSDAHGNEYQLPANSKGVAAHKCVLGSPVNVAVHNEDPRLSASAHSIEVHSLEAHTIQLEESKCPPIRGRVLDTSGQPIHANIFTQREGEEPVYLTRTFTDQASFEIKDRSFKELVPAGTLLVLIIRPRKRINLDLLSNEQKIVLPDITTTDFVKNPLEVVFKRRPPKAGPSIDLSGHFYYPDLLSQKQWPVEGFVIQARNPLTKQILSQGQTNEKGEIKLTLPNNEPFYIETPNHEEFRVVEGHRHAVRLANDVKVSRPLKTLRRPAVQAFEGSQQILISKEQANKADEFIALIDGEERGRSRAASNGDFVIKLSQALVLNQVVQVLERHGERTIFASLKTIVSSPGQEEPSSGHSGLSLPPGTDLRPLSERPRNP